MPTLNVSKRSKPQTKQHDVESVLNENVSKRSKPETKQYYVVSVLTENVTKRQTNESESIQSDTNTVNRIVFVFKSLLILKNEFVL